MTTSAGITTNSTSPALLCQPPVFPASAADIARVSTEAALLCQPSVFPASAADIARVSTEDALLCQPSVDTVSAADIVTEATPPALLSQPSVSTDASVLRQTPVVPVSQPLSGATNHPEMTTTVTTEATPLSLHSQPPVLPSQPPAWTDAVLYHQHATPVMEHASHPLSSPTIERLVTPKKRSAPTPTESPHAKIRAVAEIHTYRAANRQQKNFDRKKGAMANYSVGDTVGVRIHKVDRTNTSKKLLPCKILEETSTRDRFRVYSKDGILATTFAHTDLIDFRNVKFDDLETTDATKLKQIAHTKASREVAGFINPKTTNKTSSVCKCKGPCTSFKCSCNRGFIKCSTKCHPGNTSCLNHP